MAHEDKQEGYYLPCGTSLLWVAPNGVLPKKDERTPNEDKLFFEIQKQVTEFKPTGIPIKYERPEASHFLQQIMVCFFINKTI